MDTIETTDAGEAATAPATFGRTVALHCGDNIEALRTLEDNSIDAVVTDPPYGLSQHDAADVTAALKAWVEGKEYLVRKKGFMGKSWDSFVPGPELWKEVLRVLKPGGHALVFAGSRTDDLMGIALRLAGFEVRDKIMWMYGTGFPKSYNVAKGIEGLLENGSASWNKWRDLEGEPEPMSWGITKMTFDQGARPNDYTEIGQQRIGKCDYQHEESAKWDGWGTALKPAFEPVIVARKPLIGTVAANVLAHGTGGINIDACRVPGQPAPTRFDPSKHGQVEGWRMAATGAETATRAQEKEGRWPANVVHDGSDEVEAAFAAFGSDKGQAAPLKETGRARPTKNAFGDMAPPVACDPKDGLGTASRFFFNTRDGEESAERRYTEKGGTNFAMLPGQRREAVDSPARFFYSSKAGKIDRAGSKHPTVKPVSLIRYLVRLVTPPGGTVLDPFAGSGTTGAAAVEEGFNVVLMEREAEYQQDIIRRFDGMGVSFKALHPEAAPKPN